MGGKKTLRLCVRIECMSAVANVNLPYPAQAERRDVGENVSNGGIGRPDERKIQPDAERRLVLGQSLMAH